jgi:hypothetical protein
MKAFGDATKLHSCTGYQMISLACCGILPITVIYAFKLEEYIEIEAILN